MILLLSQVSWVGMLVTNLHYVARTELPANIMEVFPRNESDGTQLSKFHGKRIPPNVEAVGHQWLKLDAHAMCPVRFFSACVWFRDVTSFSDAPGMVCVRVGACFYRRIRLTALNHFYSNADHTRRIRKGRDVTKSDASPKKRTRRMPCASSLTLQAWKSVIFCYYKLFASGYALAQHSIPLLSAGTTFDPPIWSGRYLTWEEVLMKVVIVWFIRFYGAVHWILYWRGLSVTLSGFAFVTPPISIIMPWCTPQKFSTPLSGAPQKCFKLGPALADAGPAHYQFRRYTWIYHFKREAHPIKMIHCRIYRPNMSTQCVSDLIRKLEDLPCTDSESFKYVSITQRSFS